jgi:hypothetical protein
MINDNGTRCYGNVNILFILHFIGVDGMFELFNEGACIMVSAYLVLLTVLYNLEFSFSFGLWKLESTESQFKEKVVLCPFTLTPVVF